MGVNSPLVSAVIIFHNEERFLEQAIASVFGQDYRHWELLLVDDGSTDSSSDIGQSYAHSNSEDVQYMEHAGHQNLGMSASRNLGVENASGKYIAFLDADDCWKPNKLREQVQILESHAQAGMVYGRATYWHSWKVAGAHGGRDQVQDHWREGDTIVHPPTLLIEFLKARAAVPSISGVMARKAMVELCGGFEDSFTGSHEDQVFFSKVCLEWPVFISNRCWHYYRLHDSSYMSSVVDTADRRRNREKYLTWMIDYLENMGFEGSDVWHAAKFELTLARNPAFRGVVRRVRRLSRRLRMMRR